MPGGWEPPSITLPCASASGRRRVPGLPSHRKTFLAVDGNDAVDVLDALGPDGLWIEINGSEFATETEAAEFVGAVQARC